MKTLNEVIDLFDKGCIRPCAECPCYGMKECQEQLAAESYYLHKYQKIEDEYEELKDWWAEEHAENVQLTFDELKQMVGKPVWLVYDWNNVHYKGWILLDHLEDIFIIDAKDEWALSEVNMDNWNNWKAYRKEQR